VASIHCRVLLVDTAFADSSYFLSNSAMRGA